MKKNFIFTVVIVAIVILSCFSICAFSRRAYKLGIEEIRQSEMHYAAVKSELITEVDKYIHNIAPTSGLDGYVLVEECEYESVSLSFVLAQGELESGFGTKGLAAKTNSVWNVGAFDNLSYGQIMSKYKYRSPNDAIKPYLKTLTDRYLTAKTEEGLLNNFVDINGNRYATDTHYEERLSYKYEYIKTYTQIDSLEHELKYWAIKANRW